MSLTFFNLTIMLKIIENISLENEVKRILFSRNISSTLLEVYICRTIDDFLMETRNFITTLSKQNVKAFFSYTLIALNVKWVPRLKDVLMTSLIKDKEY